MGAVARTRGVLKAEKTDESYRLALDSQDGSVYAIVPGLVKGGTMPQNLVDFDGKNVEIYGYKRIRSSGEFPIEESIGAMDINILD